MNIEIANRLVNLRKQNSLSQEALLPQSPASLHFPAWGSHPPSAAAHPWKFRKSVKAESGYPYPAMLQLFPIYSPPDG